MKCKIVKQLDWAGRMTLETAFNPYRPIFVTPTYAFDHDEFEKTKYDIPALVRRLRKRGYNTRYFGVTEKGSKNGRLHHHLILWSELSVRQKNESARDTNKRIYGLLQEVWPYGFCFFKWCYNGSGGFKYISKYLLKEDIYHTWSRRPGLGAEGREWYRAQCERDIKKGRIRRTITVPCLGKLVRVTVPEPWFNEIVNKYNLRFPEDRQSMHGIRITAPPEDEPERTGYVKWAVHGP